MASKQNRSNATNKSSNSGKSDANSVSASSTVASTTDAKKAPVTVAATAPAATAAVAAPVAKAVAAPVTIVAPAIAATSVEAPSARAGLIARLRDQDAEVARDAAANLGRLPVDAASVDALAAVLTNTDGYFHSVVRAAAAASLGTLGDRRAVDALIHATGDSMAEASEEAIKALGLLGDRKAVVTLEKIISNQNGFFLETVRRTAQDALTRIRAGKA